MSNDIDALADIGAQKKESSGSKPEDVTKEIKLTGTDADALRAFRKGKPQEKVGTALVKSNRPKLTRLVADHLATEYAGIGSAPRKFILSCDEVRNENGEVILPAVEAKVSVKENSYTRDGFKQDDFDRIVEITHDPMLGEDEPQFVDRHFTKVVSIVIDANVIPPELLPEVISAITRLRDLQVEIDGKVRTMPAEAIRTPTRMMPKSTHHNARRTELDKDTNLRLEHEGVSTSAMVS